MPRFRPDLSDIPTYTPGMRPEDVARLHEILDVVKLASNESPVEPFPEVRNAIAAASSQLNRYPDTAAKELTADIAAVHSLATDQVWVGAGSSGLLVSIALATTHGSSSAVFASPTFPVYSMVTTLAGGAGIAVPLDNTHRHDISALVDAIRPDTNVVYICNPNNPTGTYLTQPEMAELIAAIPTHVTAVIDEAYHDYVTSADYSTTVELAATTDNVVVTRTFSKIYGLAGLRVGYAIGAASTIGALRRTQPPFAVTTLAQVAAGEALGHRERLEARTKDNAVGRELITAELQTLGIDVIESQANFVLWQPSRPAAAVAGELLQSGVVVRPLGRWIRTSVGTEAENNRFIASVSELAAN